jgi:hypothetical protein
MSGTGTSDHDVELATAFAAWALDGGETVEDVKARLREFKRLRQSGKTMREILHLPPEEHASGDEES